MLCASFAPAQNLVTNGSFDTNVTTGWTPGMGQRTWSMLDVEGSVSSGSALLTNDTGGLSAEVLSQCVPVQQNVSYGFRVSMFIESGQGVSGSGNFVVYVYADPSCFGSPLTSVSDFTQQLDTWVHLSAGLEVPATGSGAHVRLVVSNDPGTFSVHMDDVVLEPALFVDGFENGSLSAWSTTAS